MPTRQPALIGGSLGVAGVVDDEQTAGIGVEYRFRSDNRLRIVPAVGFVVTDGAAAFLYGDLRTNLWLDERWVLGPRFAYGLFLEGSHVGHDLEFRTGVELEHVFDDDRRLGLGSFHLSNAGPGDSSPGPRRSC